MLVERNAAALTNIHAHRKIRKTAVSLALAAVLAAGGSLNPAGASAETHEAAARYAITPQPVTVDGSSAVIPVIYSEGSTYIGLRALTEHLGLAIDWDAGERAASVTGRGRTLKVYPDTGVYTLNVNRLYGELPILQDGSLYVPLRFLLERLGYGVSYDQASRTIEVETIQENPLQIVTVTTDGGHPLVDAQYPQIEGFADTAVMGKINETLKKENEARIAEGIRQLGEAEKWNSELKTDNPEIETPQSVYSASYVVTYNENGRLSLYSDYYFYGGGAHGSTVRQGYTFDLKTGELLTLQEAAGSKDYVGIINREVQKQIGDTGLYLIAPFESVEPDRDYFLTHEGLVIYFQQYEYTAYAEGMPEFIIPYASFK
ncbi:copper amine oxidase [Paenibacillus mucilaginosus K02]|uniref:Copper amine oxidase n=1 Tax=Paenibacillus mucilaginosus K02 TaxID=997761 RepID=I0BMU0_9BACL|nr:copper amine oxidase [Paenibacillus mucilaginosus K02]